MKLKVFLIVFSSLSLLPGCQSSSSHYGALPAVSSLAQRSAYPSPSPVSSPSAWSTQAKIAAPATAEPEQQKVATNDLWQRIRSKLSWEDTDNSQVDKAVDTYLSQPEYMPMVSERGSLYLYYIVEEVQKRDMPMEIALIPLVESTLDPFAYSSGQAAGLWQIMPSTGENLGLQQNAWFDGRRAVRDSTTVALDYLEQLHDDFDGDWLLALAAYNAGEGRVARARQKNLDQGLPTDFWSLDLPAETRRYVPKVLALSQIVSEPASHAVDIPPVADQPAFEIAEVSGQIDLAQAAKLANISLEELLELNPGQLRSATAPNRPQELLVPVGSSARLEREVAQLTPAERVRWRQYTVKPGDSLTGIARTFKTTVTLLQQTNKISGSTIRAGSKLMIPSSDWTSGLTVTEISSLPVIGYKVRRGDSLARIAGEHKVSVEQIVAWNKLDAGQYLQPGQTLKLHVSGS